LERSPGISTLDVTGGAPELWDGFRALVIGAAALGRRVLDRCNLTVLLEPGQEDMGEFLALHRVEVVASLPCYGNENVDQQRGSGVFVRSVEALQRLNRLGYGQPDSGLRLDLVYNPLGPTLPPDQQGLERRYRDELGSRFGIVFHHLRALANLPIARFAHALERDGRLEEYLSLLVHHFNPATVPGLMCRSLVSIGYDGSLHDCDFNQMLGMPLGGQPRTVFDLETLEGLAGESIATDRHCFGCSAGAGSSCDGAIQAS
jgi:radical SAM/Cys-rich protein